MLFGGGMFLSGFAQSVGFLIISYGLMCGLGMGLVYGCTITNSVKFFPDHRGLIGGIATASYGLSSVLIPPIANLLISTSGVTAAFKTIGVAFIAIICSCSIMIEKCPENFVPDGFVHGSNNKKQAVVNRDWKEMLRSPIFYNMILMLMCGAFCGLMCTSQASSIAQKMVGMSVGAAATAVSVLALFNAFGRVAAGFVSDRIGRVNTLTIAYVLAIAGMSLLYATSFGEVGKFYLGISAVGLSFGSFMGVFPGFTADQFGPKNNGVNYGIMFIGFALAGFFGPTIMNQIYTATDSYHDAFLVAMGWQ
ncbi:OFA family MFS transporter [Eubacteriaceae bacterium ES2]|nr:OFA family MFS transporter [Eubacteriaceae bacterium ES2]